MYVCKRMYTHTHSSNTDYHWPKENQAAGSEKNAVLAFISFAYEFCV